MSRMRKSRVYRTIEKELKRSGLRWQIIPGSKHHKVYIEGELVNVFSHGHVHDHDGDAVIRSIIRKRQERHGQALVLRTS